MTRFGSSEIQQQCAVLVPFCVGQQFGPTQTNQPLFLCSNYSSLTFTSLEPLLCPQTDTLVSHLPPPCPACSAWCIWVCFICWLLNILLFPPWYLLILHFFFPVGSLGLREILHAVSFWADSSAEISWHSFTQLHGNLLI